MGKYVIKPKIYPCACPEKDCGGMVDTEGKMASGHHMKLPDRRGWLEERRQIAALKRHNKLMEIEAAEKEEAEIRKAMEEDAAKRGVDLGKNYSDQRKAERWLRENPFVKRLTSLTFGKIWGNLNKEKGNRVDLEPEPLHNEDGSYDNYREYLI